MTTIVVDSKAGFVAADRMQTENDNGTAIQCQKIYRTYPYGELHLVACAGDEGPFYHFLDWYEHGNSQPDPLDLNDDEGFTAIILTSDGQILVCDRWMRPYEIQHRFYASGSGGAFALAILEAGMGIKLAMETAIRLDPNSGFGFDIEYITDKSIKALK